MKFEEIYDNLDKVLSNSELKANLNQITKNILELIKSNPDYYFDKEYIKPFLKDLMQEEQNNNEIKK